MDFSIHGIAYLVTFVCKLVRPQGSYTYPIMDSESQLTHRESYLRSVVILYNRTLVRSVAARITGESLQTHSHHDLPRMPGDESDECWLVEPLAISFALG